MNTRTLKNFRTQLRIKLYRRLNVEAWAVELELPSVDRRYARFTRVARLLGWLVFLRRHGHAPGVWGLRRCPCSRVPYAVEVEGIARLLLGFETTKKDELAESARVFAENSSAVVNEGKDPYQMVEDILAEMTKLSGGRQA